jgi:ribosomal protein S18 acetylase RimI-like enzyme
MTRLHRAGPGDDALVLAAAGVFDEAPRPDATARFLGDPTHHLVLALDGDDVVGMVTGVETTHPDKGTEMFLYELGVADAHRNQGIGTALTKELAAIARERHCYGMWVLTDDDNAAAVRAYTNSGATAEGRHLMLGWRFEENG